MSRLLTALKRIDEGKPDQSVAPQSAALGTSTHIAPSSASVTLPVSEGFVERRATPSASEGSTASASAASAGEVLAPRLPPAPPQSTIPQFTSPQFTAPQSADWPSGGTSPPDVIPLRTVSHPGESPDVPRPSRSTNPGRRVTDRCRIAPEYAALCKSILERVSKTRPVSILVVPASEQIDAGIVVAELALAVADALDLPIVAIDADIRGPENDANDPRNDVATAGLTDVLLDRVDWRAVLAPARDQRVQLLAAGRPFSASDAIAPAAIRLGPIIAEMKTRYRCLVVHGAAPTNPLCNALVQASDLVYLVVRLGLTTHRAARTAKRQLQRGGAIVHGSIVISN
jgi:Mrp family chromosome partitioning ATPase